MKKISNEVFQALLNYLGKRPYMEVVQLIALLLQAEDIVEDKKVEEGKKEEEKVDAGKTLTAVAKRS